MFNKTTFNRSSLYETVVVEESPELDFLSMEFNLADLVISDVPTIFPVTQPYFYRPDKISQTVYGTTKYYWLLMYINNILDFDDINSIEQVLYCPSKADIDRFIADQKSKKV